MTGKITMFQDVALAMTARGAIMKKGLLGMTYTLNGESLVLIVYDYRDKTLAINYELYAKIQADEFVLVGRDSAVLGERFNFIQTLLVLVEAVKPIN